MCEPTEVDNELQAEVSRPLDPPRRAKASASNLRRPVAVVRVGKRKEKCI